MIIRIIGDVHGKQDQYVEIANAAPEGRSICLGDVGFNYDYINNHLDPEKHRIIGGNHDNYDDLSEHFLDNFGEVFGCHYIRGAYSIDQFYRVPGVDWWHQEQLDNLTRLQALEYMRFHNPRIMLTHDCPDSIKNIILDKSNYVINTFTNDLLEEVSQIRSMGQWYFGHYHEDWEMYQDNCMFKCLDELSYTDILVE